jgi:hypothetical protein
LTPPDHDCLADLTVVADRDLCPDIEVFVAGVQRSLEALERSVALTAS